MSETQSVNRSSQRILNRWNAHREVLIALTEVFPESQAGFKPTPKVMSVIELIHHLAWTPDFFLSSIEGRELKIPPVPDTLSEAKSLLKESTERHQQIIRQFSIEDLQREETIKVFNRTEPVEDILHRIITHEAHHKGQLMLYARLLDLEPPFYTIY